MDIGLMLVLVNWLVEYMHCISIENTEKAFVIKNMAQYEDRFKNLEQKFYSFTLHSMSESNK